MTVADRPKIVPLGVGAVTVDFGNEISLQLNDKAISLARHISANPFPGFIEVSPAYSSVAVFYDLTQVRRNYPEFKTAFDAVQNLIEAALGSTLTDGDVDSRTIEIPVDFGIDAALDLDHVCSFSGLTRGEVIEVFTSRTYRVYMLGFLPGFTYMGEVDTRIAVPRKDSPRKHVPRGSVGIAGSQTGIYPVDSPGGWQIIGRTDIALFTPTAEQPCLLQPGDEVRFSAVSK